MRDILWLLLQKHKCLRGERGKVEPRFPTVPLNPCLEKMLIWKKRVLIDIVEAGP